MNETHTAYLASDDWADRLRTNLLPWIDRHAALGDDILEIGPGPGLTTDILRERAGAVTAVEIDGELAARLAARLGASNVEVVHGDARQLDFAAGRFTAVTCFSMLHHVPTVQLQDAILREACRVLQPGGWLIAADTLDLEAIRAGHEGDTFLPLPPETLERRLETAGFERVQLEIGDYELRFSARKPR